MLSFTDHARWYFFFGAKGCLPACSAVIQKEDEEGKIRVKIGKELMKVAGMALKANITCLGPKVLPLSEKLIFAGNFVARKVSKLLLRNLSGLSLQDWGAPISDSFIQSCLEKEWH